MTRKTAETETDILVAVMKMRLDAIKDGARAFKWFMSASRNPGSFLRACKALGLDAEEVGRIRDRAEKYTL